MESKDYRRRAKEKIHKYMLTRRVDETKLPPIGECVSFAVIKDFR